ANSQPYCHLHMPGVGVGGYCIPVYPRFLIHVARRLGLELPLTELARQINLSMPGYTAELVDIVARELGSLKPRIAVLGLAFRGGIDDTRLSPTYDLIDHLMKKGYELITVHDPYVAEDRTLRDLGLPLTHDLAEAVRGKEVVVIATDHPEYADLTPTLLQKLAETDRLAIVDGRLVVKEWRSPPKGVIYVGVGRPLVKASA
ncbi:MAG: UDP binding domain-containing protein, partial [Thermofilaceae archaeon]